MGSVNNTQATFFSFYTCVYYMLHIHRLPKSMAMESESESISEHVSCMEEAARDPAQQGEDGTGTDEETEKA